MAGKDFDPTDRVIGDFIRFYRMRKGISQVKLGKNIGVSFQQVQKYEKGLNRVPSSRLLIIARILDVPMNAFFGEAHNDVTPLLALTGNRLTFRLLDAFSQISNERYRDALVRMVEALAVPPNERGWSAGRRHHTMK
jgi:transcriptional regulator with XRE-family HTH domain